MNLWVLEGKSINLELSQKLGITGWCEETDLGSLCSLCLVYELICEISGPRNLTVCIFNSFKRRFSIRAEIFRTRLKNITLHLTQ